MFGKKDSTQLRDELDAVKAEIAANPLSQDSVQKAQLLIEEMKADGREEEIDQELSNRHLPSLTEIGKLIAQHTFTLARLNRKRIKLERKLGDAL
ncbi:hypothetical protein KJY78_03320 [Canibacter sp. lx-45]|uniref:hypothetical protein n=1 Tax=Canibacter zhuwentaonis TaxID=2837491 RepID=UPI001BDCE531|nr:hypothetical protein [Canibacter zhuwentaonis]MBT1035382.1 hypothetical protein [Canibacter zhuwentaonis]